MSQYYYPSDKEEYAKILNENMKDLREKVVEVLYLNIITIQIQKIKLAFCSLCKNLINLNGHHISYLNPIENVLKIVKQKVNLCDLSKSPEVIVKIKKIWSELD